MRSIKVLFLTQFERRVGGAETYLNAIVPAIAIRGFQVGICCIDEGPLNRQLFEFPETVLQWSLKNMSHRGNVLDQISKWEPDIVFCHGISDLEFEAEILNLAPGIFYAHNYYGVCISGLKAHKFPQATPCTRAFGPSCLLQYFPRRCGGGNPLTMVRLYEANSSRLAMLRRYVVLAANSEYLANEYRRYGMRVECLPLFAQTDASVQPKPKAVNPNQAQLLFVGRMDQLKGGRLLLESLSEIRSRVSRDIHLVFVGDGPDCQKWRDMATQIHSRERGISIEFKGWLKQSELPEVLTKAELLMFPSIWPEPFGLVGIEAGLYGVPAVAFKVGGVPEWLHDGENGRLARSGPPTAKAFAEAVVHALDPKSYMRLSLRARQFAQEWTLARHCTALVCLIEKIVKDRSFARG